MEKKLINMILDDATTDGEKINAIDKLKRRLKNKNLTVGVLGHEEDLNELQDTIEQQMREIIYLKKAIEGNTAFYEHTINNLQKLVNESNKENKELQLEIASLYKERKLIEENNKHEKEQMFSLCVLATVLCSALSICLF